jgi:hypothetical protein
MYNRLTSFGEYVTDTAIDVKIFIIDAPGMIVDGLRRVRHSERVQNVVDTLFDHTVDISRNQEKKEMQNNYEQRQNED